MARRGKFVSWSMKGVRVGYGRHNKQALKTGCLVFLASLLSVGVLAITGTLGATADLPERPSWPVTWVIDGDTLVVKGEGKDTTVRLLGTDAPRTRCAGEANGGVATPA